MNWTELNTLLKFEISATWNFKRITANCSLRFAVSREKPDSKFYIYEKSTIEYNTERKLKKKNKTLM